MSWGWTGRLDLSPSCDGRHRHQRLAQALKKGAAETDDVSLASVCGAEGGNGPRNGICFFLCYFRSTFEGELVCLPAFLNIKTKQHALFTRFLNGSKGSIVPSFHHFSFPHSVDPSFCLPTFLCPKKIKKMIPSKVPSKIYPSPLLRACSKKNCVLFKKKKKTCRSRLPLPNFFSYVTADKNLCMRKHASNVSKCKLAMLMCMRPFQLGIG